MIGAVLADILRRVPAILGHARIAQEDVSQP
jgi:hypothetical protein